MHLRSLRIRWCRVVCAGWLALAASSAWCAAASGEPVRYFIDPSHSSIEFTVPFMGIARVSGTINQFYGRVEHDPAEPRASSAEVVMRVASLDTRNGSRDRDLLSEKYFDAERFPVIRYRSRKAELRDGAPVLIGNLTIRDVTREVELPVEILGSFESDEGRQLGAEATTTLDRREFGISRGQFSGDQAFIGNEVTIRLLMRLREPSPAKQRMAAEHPEAALEESRLREFVGEYRDESRGFELGVYWLAGELALGRIGTLHRLVAIEDGRFRVDDLEAFVEFEAGDEAPMKLTFERARREPQVYFRAD